MGRYMDTYAAYQEIQAAYINAVLDLQGATVGTVQFVQCTERANSLKEELLGILKELRQIENDVSSN